MKVTILPTILLTRLEWADRLRALSYAMGVTTRQQLLGAAHTGSRPIPEPAREALRELISLTELAGSQTLQLIAPTPRRYIALDDKLFVALGGPPQRISEIPCLTRVGRRDETETQDGPWLSLELWLDYRRDTVLGPQWLAAQMCGWMERAFEPLPDIQGCSLYDAGRDAPHHEGRWRTPRRREDGSFLLRTRDQRGGFQHLWSEWTDGRLLSARRISPESACVTRYALDRCHQNPVLGKLLRRNDRFAEVWLPSWIPRAEFRLLCALAQNRPQNFREPWELPIEVAKVATELIAARLGLDWEGSSQ